MIDKSKLINRPKRRKKAKKALTKAEKRLKAQNKAKKLKLKKNKIDRLKFTQSMAKKLQNEPPKSDQWFQSLFNEYKLENDEYNQAFGFYIPDLINHKYRYIIEIDSSYHLRQDQIKKDVIKNKYYLNNGYECYRIQAYNEDRFKMILQKVLKRREQFKYS